MNIWVYSICVCTPRYLCVCMHTHTHKSTGAYSQRFILFLLQDYLAFMLVDMQNRWWCLLQLHNRTFNGLCDPHAERKEKRTLETSSRSIHEKEIPLASLHVSNTRSYGNSGRDAAGRNGTWTVLSLQPREGRIMPYREWNARRNGDGASAQKDGIFGSEFFYPFSHKATAPLNGNQPPRS